MLSGVPHAVSALQPRLSVLLAECWVLTGRPGDCVLPVTGTPGVFLPCVSRFSECLAVSWPPLFFPSGQTLLVSVLGCPRIPVRGPQPALILNQPNQSSRLAPKSWGPGAPTSLNALGHQPVSSGGGLFVAPSRAGPGVDSGWCWDTCCSCPPRTPCDGL